MCDHVSRIAKALKGLNTVAKNKIEELTELARSLCQQSEDFISLLDSQLHSTDSNNKLPYIYLMDSILKNIPQHYSEIIALHISDSFMHIFTTVDERTKISLYKLFTTWLYYLPPDLLQELSDRVRFLDPYWPILDIHLLVRDPSRFVESKYGPSNVNPNTFGKPPIPTNNVNNVVNPRKRPTMENIYAQSPTDPRQLTNVKLSKINSELNGQIYHQYNNNLSNVNNLHMYNQDRPIGAPIDTNINVLIPPLSIRNSGPVPVNNIRPYYGTNSMAPHGHVNPRFLPSHLRKLAYSHHIGGNNNPNYGPPRQQIARKDTCAILKDIVINIKGGTYNSTVNPPTISPLNTNISIVKPDFSIITLDKNILKIYNELIIKYHLSGKMCYSCGRRFPEENKAEYSKHLDWHFCVNRRRFSNKLSRRTWFNNPMIDVNMNDCNEEDVLNDKTWVKNEIMNGTSDCAIGKLEPIENGHLQKTKNTEILNDLNNYAPGKITFTDDPEIAQRSKFPSCMAIFDKKDDDICATCKEKFDQFWHEELEEWHYEQAIRIDEIAYHDICKPKTKSEQVEKIEPKKSMDFTKLNSTDMAMFLNPKK